MIEYFLQYYTKLFSALSEHIYLLGMTLLFGVPISLILGFLIYHFRPFRTPVMFILKIIYTIPSLAFFAVLIPFSGLGTQTAIIVLVFYTLFFLVSHFLNGLNGIDAKVLEAGIAMGYSKWQLFWKVQLPIATPSLLSGIRISAISTISISCIAYAIGAGGLGSILFEGMRQISYVKILWGTIFVILLNIIVNTLLIRIERFYIKHMHLND